MKKGALRNITKFTGKHLWSEASNFIKKETLAQVFSCEFCEISKNTFLQNTSGRLLLQSLLLTMFSNFLFLYSSSCVPFTITFFK